MPFPPKCCSDFETSLNRREFVRNVGGAAAVGLAGNQFISNVLANDTTPVAKTDAVKPEQLVRKLYESLNEQQKKEICFAWDYQDNRGQDKRGLLRTHVSNNWSITNKTKFNVGGKFYTKDQQDMIEAIFWGLYNPEWQDRIKKQLKDDAGGYGKEQTIAMFGDPATNQFEFVMTGRHLTVRCDGDSAEHVAFGGPIFYGHAAQGFDEKPNHPGNVFWPQALEANKLFEMLDGKQREQALLKTAPFEDEVAFRGVTGKFDGISIAELTSDQKEHAQGVLRTLLEPYRVSDQDEVYKCLKTQGGLDKCAISFYQEDDLGDDKVLDIWRIEGPSFVWHYRGAPHVHVWVNVADNSNVELNAAG